AFRIKRFSTVDIVRTADDVERGTVARSTVHLSKHIAGLLAQTPMIAYDSKAQTLTVPLGADLPGLYGRTVVAASGLPPTANRGSRSLTYSSVPPELARHIYDLFRR